MATALVVHYETTTGRYYTKNIATAQIEDLAVTSAKLAAAIITLLGSVADGAIISAKIASGAVGDAHIYPGSILSAKIAANAIGGGHILDGSLTYADLADATLVSSKYGTNEIGTIHILNQGILSASYGANVIATPHIAAGGILSGAIGAAVIGDALLANYGIVSGKVASGAITENELVSGISIDIAEMMQEPSYRAQQLLSACLGVQFNISGYFNYAQAGDISSMPAVGLTIGNILSGQIGTFRHLGRIANGGWNFSGYVGRLLFTGTSSEVTLTAPSSSGECVQRIGKVIDYGTVFVRPEMLFVQLAA